MRSLTANQTKILGLMNRRSQVRVKIKDNSGTYQDYSTRWGLNWQKSVEWDESTDQYLGKAHIELKREYFSRALPPYISGSVANASSATSIQIGREFTIETATVVLGSTPQSSDWVMGFHGYITNLDWTEDSLAIDGYDLAQRLQDTWIETQRDYGKWAPGRTISLGTVVVPSTQDNAAPPVQYWVASTAGVTAGAPWQANHTYTAGNIVSTVNPDAPGYQRYFKAQTGFTSSPSTEPSWPGYGTGSQCNDGSTVNAWIEYFGGVNPSGTGVPEPPWPGSPPANGTTLTDGTVVWTYHTVQTWTAGATYNLGDLVNPTTTGETTQTWMCVQSSPAHTAGGSDPFTGQANPSLNTVVNDGSNIKWQFIPSIGGTLAETVMQSILTDNVSGITLQTPVSSGWFLKSFTQDRSSLWQALTKIAAQIGWDLRYWWNSGLSDFAPTFQALARTSPSVVWTFDASHIVSLKECARSIDTVRNVVRVIYSDRSLNTAASFDPTQTSQAVRSEVVASDSTSIGAYGRRAMEINEGSASQISDSTAANALATAVLNDLKEPGIEVQLEMPYFFPIQLFDYITVNPLQFHFDQAQSLAVSAISHKFTDKEQSTTITASRLYPSLGPTLHGSMASEGQAVPNKLTSPSPAATPSISATIGGVIVNFRPPTDIRMRWSHAELHLFTSNNFIPNASTLYQTSKSGRFEITGLTPTQSYYARIVHRDIKGNASPPSTVVTVQAGQAKLVHLDPTIRRQLFGYVPSDYTTATTGGRVNYQTNGASIYNFSPYDTGSNWDNTNFWWTPDVAGKYYVRASAEMIGMAAGDSAILGMYNTNASVFYAYSPVAQAVTDPWSIRRNYVLLVATINVSSADVAAGAHFYFELRYGPMPYSTALTVKAPSGGLSWTSAARYGGSLVEISQVLA